LKKKSNDPYIEKRCFNCQVRLIDTTSVLEKNKYYDSISMTEAQNIASAAQVDLVCFEKETREKLAFYKVMNFGKWKYDTAKKKKKQQKVNKKTTKEIRVRAVIEDHDLAHKIKQADKFLQDGDDVLFTMRLKGRERIYTSEAKIRIVEIANMCENVDILNKKFEGNYFSVRVAKSVKKKD